MDGNYFYIIRKLVLLVFIGEREAWWGVVVGDVLFVFIFFGYKFWGTLAIFVLLIGLFLCYVGKVEEELGGLG